LLIIVKKASFVKDLAIFTRIAAPASASGSENSQRITRHLAFPR
jgi:hypothetical protein